MSTRNKETCEFSIGASHQISLKIPLAFPTSQHARDLAYRILQLHGLPIFYHSEISEKLKAIIKEKNYEFYRKKDERNLEALRNETINIKSVASYWSNKFCIDKQDSKPKDKEDLPAIYHSLVHSPSVHTLLSREQSYADAVSTLVAQKEATLEELQNKQALEMQHVVRGVGSRITDEDVNELAARHLEDTQLTEVQWDSTLSALKEEQKREFRKFISESFEGREITTPITPKDFISNSSISHSDFVVCDSMDEPVKEESFTIHLGTQMKQMHNLRLIAADVLQLLRYQQLDDSDIPPQRIQTSMSLYSHNLNGLVLLVNDRVNTYTGIKKDFGRVCSRSTELHFPELEDQLETVRNAVPQVAQWRKGHPPPQYEGDEENQNPVLVPKHLKSGDFYITRHSNLPDVHAVFHMVVDEGLSSSDINSRHSVILGLRNVLKVACLADITTLTVPLLLTHTLTEEMTIPWCQKRAELVYKCIKGFMIEMSSWGGAEMKNLQFLVPKGISDELFNNLASMLQSIFRLSNPLIVKTTKQDGTRVT